METIDMTAIIERIREATKNREYDGIFAVAAVEELWEACRSYLMRFEIAALEDMDPSEIVDRGAGKPIDWDEHVRCRLASVARKYGCDDVTAAVKGVEYKVDVGQPECASHTQPVNNRWAQEHVVPGRKDYTVKTRETWVVECEYYVTADSAKAAERTILDDKDYKDSSDFSWSGYAVRKEVTEVVEMPGSDEGRHA